MTSSSGMEREATRTLDDEPHELRRLRLGPIDALVAITVVGLAVWWFRLTDSSWFFADEWQLALRGHSLGDFLEPYNGHLSITPIGVYRVHYGLFGFDQYWFLRVIGLSALVSVPAVLYLISRTRVPPIAAGLCAVLLIMSTNPGLEPGGMNHNIALTFGLIATWAMAQEGRRFDLIVAAALLVSLASAGDALPFAVALLLLCAVRRVPLQRWTAVAVPVGLWLLWRMAIGDPDRIPAILRVSFIDKVLLAPRSLPATLRGLTAGSSAAALLLGAALLAGLVHKLRTEGRAGLGSVVAWMAAWEAWWFGLADSRGLFAVPETFRYRFAASVFLALAVLPIGATRTTSGADLAGVTDRHGPVRPPTPMRYQWLVAAVLALIAVGLVFANLTTTLHDGHQMEAYGQSAKKQFLVATAIPTVVPLDTQHPFGMGAVTQQQLLDLARRYGPKPLSPEQLDVWLLDQGSGDVSDIEAAPNEDCDPIPRRINATGTPILFRTTDEPAWVSARLFGDEDVRLVEIPPGSAVTVRPPTDVLGRQWILTTGPVCVGR